MLEERGREGYLGLSREGHSPSTNVWGKYSRIRNRFHTEALTDFI